MSELLFKAKAYINSMENKQSNGVYIYTLKAGDTIYDIAKALSDGKDIHNYTCEIAGANKIYDLGDCRKLKVNQKIAIPSWIVKECMYRLREFNVIKTSIFGEDVTEMVRDIFGGAVSDEFVRERSDEFAISNKLKFHILDGSTVYSIPEQWKQYKDHIKLTDIRKYVINLGDS